MKLSRKKHTSSLHTSEESLKMAALAEGMADDFNNILTTVMGACSLIDKNDPTNSELIQYVSLIRTSAERAAVLSDRLMRVATIEEKTTILSSSDISVRDKRA